MKKLPLLLVLAVGLGLAAGCGESTVPTTTTTSTTTTTLPIIRLYYAFPADPSLSGDYSNQRIGSALSTNGINFTPETGSRLSGAYIGAPDLIKETSGSVESWTLFYSKAYTSEAPTNTLLFKATCLTATGTFATDAAFVDGYGNISASNQVGSTWYNFGSTSSGLLISSYEPTADRMTYVKKAADEGTAPSVIQVGSYYLLYYKIALHTYCAKSFDGLNWETAALIVNNAEVPGAVYLGDKIYLYYVDSFASSITSGKILVRTSTDGGLTYSDPYTVTGLPDKAYDPCPMEYE